VVVPAVSAFFIRSFGRSRLEQKPASRLRHIFSLPVIVAALGLQGSALAVGGICILAGFAALASLEETFHKDLDYLEEFL